jgi:uncharacterized paraquat-inducible protein A
MKQLLAFATIAVASFVALHVLGFREDVAVLSGSRVPFALGGVAYGLAYFAVVVGAPVALLAAAVLGIESRIRRP